MKVICIDGGSRLDKRVTKLVKGDMYTVIETEEVIGFRTEQGNRAIDGVYYKLIENGHWYHNSLFVVVNENQQDETEMVRDNITITNANE